MSGLIGYIEETEGDGIFVPMATRFTNEVGTPLVSATANDSGEDIPDTYQLTFSSVAPGVSATVTVSTGSPSNPYDGRTKVVSLDGFTTYDNIVGGSTLVFSASGSFGSSWSAQVRAGNSFGSFNAFPPDAGSPSDSRTIKVVNTGSNAGVNCLARLLNIAKRYRITGHIFNRTKTFAEGSTEKLSGDQVIPYEVQVSGVSGVGAAKIMDVRVDGSLVTVLNLTTEVLTTSAGLNVVDYYQVMTGGLTDLVFLLSQNAVNMDEENVLVFSPRFTQIANDSSGAPGTWGVADVPLTEEGEADGVITSSGFTYFHTRVVVTDGDNSSSNPYPCGVALQGANGAAAGWVD